MKLEGGERVLPMVEAIARADIPVLGHLGLTPQSVHRMSGYRVQGRSSPARAGLLREARLLEAAGCFGIVLEAIPARLAGEITAAVGIPTLGIGAGSACDGQVLVLHDLLGAATPGCRPKFVKRYADVRGEMRRGIGGRAYCGGGPHARIPRATAHLRDRAGGAHPTQRAAGGSPAGVNA